MSAAFVPFLLTLWALGCVAITQYHGHQQWATDRAERDRLWWMWREVVEPMRLPISQPFRLSCMIEPTRRDAIIRMDLRTVCCAISRDIRATESLEIIARNTARDMAGNVAAQAELEIFWQLKNAANRRGARL